MRKSVSENDFGPIVVHCSAGVGRAGSFVTVDVQLEKYATEKQIDVFAGLSCYAPSWLLM